MLVSIAHKSCKGTGKTWVRTPAAPLGALTKFGYIRVDGNTPISVRLTRRAIDRLLRSGGQLPCSASVGVGSVTSRAGMEGCGPRRLVEASGSGADSELAHKLTRTAHMF